MIMVIVMVMVIQLIATLRIARYEVVNAASSKRNLGPSLDGIRSSRAESVTTNKDCGRLRCSTRQAYVFLPDKSMPLVHGPFQTICLSCIS